MNIWQIVFTLIFFIWMFLALVLLWRHALGGSAHVQRLRLTIADLTAKNTEIAKTAAETALKAAETAQASAKAVLHAMQEERPHDLQ